MVRSFVWGPNTRSQAALRKQGYRDAGGFRWQSTVGADFVDTVTFDLLASEWRERVDRAAGAHD
jgi:RimJ/RimL family protein N-acetyltransferase